MGSATSWGDWGEGGETRGVARDRDWPFILKGLFTMVISAWGTGYNTRYQGIKARSVQRVFLFYLDLTNCILLLFLFFVFCVWEIRLSENLEEHYQCHYLKREAGSVSASTIVLFFVAERNLQVHFVSEMLFQHPCFSSCWCVYYKYSSVCWDLLSPHSPPIRDRGSLDL